MERCPRCGDYHNLQQSYNDRSIQCLRCGWRFMPDGRPTYREEVRYKTVWMCHEHGQAMGEGETCTKCKATSDTKKDRDKLNKLIAHYYGQTKTRSRSI